MSSDVELLHSWRDGDKDAGRELFERYFPSLRRFFGNKVASGVEDLVQSTMLACVESRDRIRDDSKFRAYLFGTARKQLLSVYASRRRDPVPLDTGIDCASHLCPSPSLALARRGEDRLLLEAVRGIPLDFQMILELYYWEQLSTAELAQMLGVPLSTIKNRLVRARALLREQVDELSRAGERVNTTEDDIHSWARRIREYADREGT
ncbi:MAG: sigma-70 family RNA polymerase sigma factor [Nannocystaceae bacterium]